MFIVGVEALFEFLSGPSFSSDYESWDLGIFCGAFFAGDFDEGEADLVGDLLGDGLANLARGKSGDDRAIFVGDLADNLGDHESPAIGDGRHGSDDLDGGGGDFLSDGHAGDGDFAPSVRRVDDSPNFSWKADACLDAESEAVNIVEEFLIAEAHGEFGGADVAGVDEDIVDGEVGVGVVILEIAPLVKAIFAIDHRIWIAEALIENGGDGDDFKSGTWLDLGGDGEVHPINFFYAFLDVEIKVWPIGEGENFASFGIEHHHRRPLGAKFFDRGVEFLFDDILQTHIDRQADVISCEWWVIGAAFDLDGLTPAGSDDIAGTIVSAEEGVHGHLHTVDPFAFVVHKADDVAKHLVVWVEAISFDLEGDASQYFGFGEARFDFFDEMSAEIFFEDDVGGEFFFFGIGGGTDAGKSFEDWGLG